MEDADPERRARELTENLFRDGAGTRADRLVLTRDTEPPHHFAGWCRSGVRGRIEQALRAVATEAREKERERAARVVEGFNETDGDYYGLSQVAEAIRRGEE